MRTFLVFLLAAAACTSSRRHATLAKPPVVSTRSYPAPLYAELFVKGARHTYTVESRSSHWDDQDPRADQHGNVEETFTGSMTCTVTEVHELPSAIASRIECEDSGAIVPMVFDGPAGVYVATADGLWGVPEIPRDAPTTAKYKLFAWPPVASTSDEPDPNNPGWGSRIVVAQDHFGWCRYLTFISGDDGDEELCVGDGIVTRGSASSSGGSSYGMSYTLAPK